MPSLFAPVCSIAPTRRRRFMWVAWWTGAPTREPFRKPDAFEGGARTREEALAAASLATGMHLVEIEPRWARAWGRVLVGQPAWPAKGRGKDAGASAPGATARVGEEPRASVWAVLGVAPGVNQAELKRAFRKRVLETHPDRGGTAEGFREVQRAYEEAVRRVARPRRGKR